MTVVRQRGDADCGCGALSTYLGETYEDTYLAIARIDARHRGKNGLHNHELIAAAKLMGVKLHQTRRYDLDEDEGVLRVRWNDPTKRRGGHFVAIVDGRIGCPSDGVAVPWREYLERNNGRACTLLREIA